MLYFISAIFFLENRRRLGEKQEFRSIYFDRTKESLQSRSIHPMFRIFSMFLSSSLSSFLRELRPIRYALLSQIETYY